jgi:phosphoenolpyruvate carboxykinase (ATP)
MSVLANSATSGSPMGPNGVRLPAARSVRYNPSPPELQELTSRMPQARRTSFGNYNVQTRVTSRSAGSTFLVTDDPSITTGKSITTEEGRRVANVQAE